MNAAPNFGWDSLRHGGLLLDPQRVARIAEHVPASLSPHLEQELRRQATGILEGSGEVPEFVTFVLQRVCGFSAESGTWQRGSQVGSEWTRRAVTGEAVKPRQLWRGREGGILPVFIDSEPRLGQGRGRRAVSQVHQWLRSGSERLALMTNGRQWRLVFAGLDFDAWCEWDVDLWFEQGVLSYQVSALRTLLAPELWIPPAKDAIAPLLQAVLDSRKGRAELSAVLGERVREAVEILVQAHGEVIKERCSDVEPADIYRAAVRVVMRLVVALFAESRDLLPRDIPFYYEGYGVAGLLEELDKTAARGGNRLARSWSAWPRLLALFRLIYCGSHHEALSVPAYGGELFVPGDCDATDGLSRTLAVFEAACFEREIMSDREVFDLLNLLTRTRIKIRQGRTRTWMMAPVDFSDLSSEYIGILYEGLLDFELKMADAGDPVIFLSVGHEPALPLSRLEAMDDKALANLLEKMKNTRRDGDEESSDENGESSDESGEEEDLDVQEETEEGEELGSEAGSEIPEHRDSDTGDKRRTVRTRAETWARRAVLVGKLVPKPRGALTPEKQLAHEQAIGWIAGRLVTRVVLPGEYYLVRWGGTRKGAGTFYTRPGLAVPTVHRTLRPLAYNAPLDADRKPNYDAPPFAWNPKKPEEILALKVCDPACGSGTFPVAALRFLTEAVYEALHAHNRLEGDIGRPLDEILGLVPAGGLPESIRAFRLPCRPGEDEFEKKTKAVLRRYVVERSIYGVDIDPLAVELCRLSLWIETMDRTLPFSFLDHKIKCGNSLVGAWFDQFRHYPAMAWKNREGGDKNHTNGVHFAKESRTRAIKAFVKDRLIPDLALFLSDFALFPEGFLEKAEAAHEEALAVLSRLHEFPIHETAERALVYRKKFLGSETYRSLKTAMDLWCACWFCPADELDKAPLPTSFSSPASDTLTVAESIAQKKRFFHWELEFPDVFRSVDSGFDVVLGNPPWDIAKPNSQEFFSNIDPLYRSYGKQEALSYQKDYFKDIEIERSWLDYSADFRAQSNFTNYSSSPYGDPSAAENNQDRFTIVRGKENETFHKRWREARSKSRGYSDSAHPFRRQGSADLNLYKLFLEQVHALLRKGGRFGFIIPSGLYSDHGTGGLRRLFLDHCRWEWLFGFENREGIFDTHRSFKFNPVIIEKGGSTAAIRTAFMRRKVEDWERGEELATPYSRAQVERFSPRSHAILVIQSNRDLEILEKIYSNSVLLGDEGPNGWGTKYSREFDMTNDSKLFPPRPWWEAKGFRRDMYSRWISEDGSIALPVFVGKMVGNYDFSQHEWISGKGRGARWRSVPWDKKILGPDYLMAVEDYRSAFPNRRNKIGFMDITTAVHQRTMMAAYLPDFPCSHLVPTLSTNDNCLDTALELAGFLNSFPFDFCAKRKIGYLHLTKNVIDECPLPRRDRFVKKVDLLIAKLSLCHDLFAHEWIELASQHEELHKFSWKANWACTLFERLRIRASVDAIMLAIFGLSWPDARHLINDCDWPINFTDGRPNLGFWRVDKDKDPELRLTVLTLVAFHDLDEKIRAAGGDHKQGIESFLNQNDGEGWMPPETVCLSDYGLGHDERARHAQPVTSRLGPRYYDWQLAHSVEESWRECHIHARNLLGDRDYNKFLEDIDKEKLKAEYPLAGETGIFPMKKVTEQQGPLFSSRRDKEST